MTFDPATLLTMAFLTLLLLALVLASVLKRSREGAAGPWWVASFALGASGFLVLIALRPEPDSWLQTVANTLFLAAYGCCHAAARALGGRRPLIASVIAAAAVWPIVVAVLAPGFGLRVVICSTLIAIYALAAALEFARGAGRAERYRWMAAGLCATHALFYLVRAVWGPTLGFANAATEEVVSAWGAVIALEVVLFAAAMATLVVAIALERASLAERRAALTDHLTGVGNRRAFDEAMESERAGSAGGEPATLLLLDLDRFKDVNDRFGHQAGDDLLKAFAMAVGQALPDPNLFWRLGGDEFAVLVRGCEPEQVERLKAALRQAVNASEGCTLLAEGVRISVSIGSATLAPGEPAADVIRRADAALYHEKSQRRRNERATHRPARAALAEWAAA